MTTSRWRRWSSDMERCIGRWLVCGQIDGLNGLNEWGRMYGCFTGSQSVALAELFSLLQCWYGQQASVYTQCQNAHNPVSCLTVSDSPDLVCFSTLISGSVRHAQTRDGSWSRGRKHRRLCYLPCSSELVVWSLSCAPLVLWSPDMNKIKEPKKSLPHGHM